MATINKEQMEKVQDTHKIYSNARRRKLSIQNRNRYLQRRCESMQMLYKTLDEMLQKGKISRKLKEGGDPENPDDWLYYMDDKQSKQR